MSERLTKAEYEERRKTDPGLDMALRIADVLGRAFMFFRESRKYLASRLRDTDVPAGEKCEFIYALRHPETFEVCYVGRTDHFDRRVAQHLATASGGDRRAEWIAALRSQGLSPVPDVLERVPVQYAAARERFWIAVCAGEHLLNQQHSGEMERLSEKRESLLRDIARRESELFDLRELARCLEDPREAICAAYCVEFDPLVELRLYEAFRRISGQIIGMRAINWGGLGRGEVVRLVAEDMRKSAERFSAGESKSTQGAEHDNGSVG